MAERRGRRPTNGTWLAVLAPFVFAASCVANPTIPERSPSTTASSSEPPVATPTATPSAESSATPTPTPSPSPSAPIDPAAGYRIAPPHTLTIDTDATESTRIAKLLTDLLADASATAQVGTGQIDADTFPSTLTVIRVLPGALGQADIVDRIVQRLVPDTDTRRLGVSTVLGSRVVVMAIPCFGDPGGVCFMAGFAHAADLVLIGGEATRPLTAARALASAVLSATP